MKKLEAGRVAFITLKMDHSKILPNAKVILLQGINKCSLRALC